MKVGVTANPAKPAALAMAERAVARLTPRCEVVVNDEAARSVAGGSPVAPLRGMAVDVLVAFGGDGTFLRALQVVDAPILAINAGTLGVLAEVDGRDPGALDRALDRLCDGRYTLEPRMRLSSAAGGNALPEATNDVVVHSDQVGRIRRFEIAVDGEVTGHLRADGVLVATPTGSTSYALAAHGPIVEPSIDAIVVVGLLPFRAPSGAIVLDPLRSVRIRLEVPDRGGVVVVDGQEPTPLAAGVPLLVHRSPRPARFIRFGSTFLRQIAGKRILPWSSEVSEEDGARGDLPTDP